MLDIMLGIISNTRMPKPRYRLNRLILEAVGDEDNKSRSTICIIPDK
jgi:hypothetical protein